MQGLDRYGYVNNNPLRYADPSGHCVVGGHEMPDDSPACNGNYSYHNTIAKPEQNQDKNQEEDKDHDPNLWDLYKQGWANFGSAWSILNNPNAGWGNWAIAGGYLLVWGGAHVALGLGIGGLACAASGPGCVAAVEGELGIGTATSADGDPTNELQALVESAKQLYPKLADKTHLHHVFPRYLGGDPAGPVVRLNAAYHQLITNEFRAEWAYGQGAPPLERALEIMQKVYGKFPLP